MRFLFRVTSGLLLLAACRVTATDGVQVSIDEPGDSPCEEEGVEGEDACIPTPYGEPTVYVVQLIEGEVIDASDTTTSMCGRCLEDDGDSETSECAVRASQCVARRGSGFQELGDTLSGMVTFGALPSDREYCLRLFLLTDDSVDANDAPSAVSCEGWVDDATGRLEPSVFATQGIICAMSDKIDFASGFASIDHFACRSGGSTPDFTIESCLAEDLSTQAELAACFSE